MADDSKCVTPLLQINGCKHTHVHDYPCVCHGTCVNIVASSLMTVDMCFRWFDNTLFTMFRGKRCYDGGLTNFIPLPPTQHGVRVCCFPSKQITTIYDIGISPDNYEDWPHTLQEMLSWAFEPADEELLLEFISKFGV